MTIDLLTYLILILAAYRTTRLITTDVVLDGFRNWVWARQDPGTKIGYLISCNWCTGFWVSLVFILGHLLVPNVTFVVSLVLSTSALVGIISSKAE
jgi:hypothetical protein